jgi:hypothetical protein
MDTPASRSRRRLGFGATAVLRSGSGRQLAGQRAKRGGRDRQRSHLDGLARPGQRLDVLVSP